MTSVRVLDNRRRVTVVAPSRAMVTTVGLPGPPSVSPGGIVAGAVNELLQWDAGGALIKRKKQVFDVRDYGAIAAASDNRVAIQNAINAAQTAGGGVVWLPELYKVTSSGGNIGFGSAKPYGLLISGNDITFDGPGGLDFRGLYAILGDEYHGIAIGTAIGLTNRIGSENVDLLTGSYAKGVRTLTLDTGLGANYQAGDWVYIRTGNCVAATTSIADSEINQVLAVSGDVLTLRWPTAKPYAQEYFITGTTGVTSTDVTANLAKYGVKNLSRPDNWIVQRPAFRNITLYADTAYAFVTMFHPVGCVFDRITASLVGSLAQGTARGTRLINSRIHIDPPGGATPTRDCQTHWIAAGDTHSTDCLVSDNDLSSSGNGWIHIQEGVAQIKILRNRMVVADGATQWGAGTGFATVNCDFRVYDIEVGGNDIRGSGGGGQAGIRVGGACNGGGKIWGNDIDGISGATAISVGSDNWHVAADNRSNGKGVRRSLVFTNAGAQANTGVIPTEPVVLQGWLTPDRTEITLGVIPQESVVTSVRYIVDTAFNSDGTDQVKVGYDSTGTTQQAWAALTDVIAASPAPVTPNAGLAQPYTTAQRTAKAYYVAGGSAPTTGKVLVILTYAPAMLRP